MIGRPISRNGICQEAILIYRNALVDDLRKRLMTAFGETWINEVRSLFSKPTADGRTQWQKTVQDAIEPRERHHIISRLRDEFDCISVGQFQNIIERYFDQIFPQLTDSPSKKSTRSSILELVRNVTAVRNAISHPSERDIDSWD